MIKKFLIIFALLGMFSKADALYLDFEGRVAYVLPTAKSGKRLYSGTPLSYQLETSMHFAYFWRDIPWKVWGNVTWLPATGHLRRDEGHHNDLHHLHSDGIVTHHHHHKGHFEPKAETNWIPVSLGLKYTWGLCGLGGAYLGLGGSFSYYRIKLRNDFFERRIHKNQMGVVFKSGWNFAICNIFFDLFADYYINSFGIRKAHHDFFELNTPDLDHFNHSKRGHRHLNLNCFMAGGGIGYIF